MKNQTFMILAVFWSSIFLISCKVRGTRDVTDAVVENNIDQPEVENEVPKEPEEENRDPEIYSRADNIKRLENSLEEKFGVVFKKNFYSPEFYEYKIQVPSTSSKWMVIRDLENYEIEAQRFLDMLPKGHKDYKLKKLIRLKLSAAKYFLVNHDRDSTLFIPVSSTKDPETSNPPENYKLPNNEEVDPNVERGVCPDIQGKYIEIGPRHSNKVMQIYKNGCTSFFIKRFKNDRRLSIKFEQEKTCNSMGSYKVCVQTDTGNPRSFGVIINETWLNTMCKKRSDLTFDLYHEMVILYQIQECKDRAKSFSKEIKYFREKK